MSNAFPQNLKTRLPKVAVVGCGNWGKNLVRNFHQLGALAYCCDKQSDVLLRLSEQYPEVPRVDRFEELLTFSALDALVIATPSRFHYGMAKAALLAGKHVYVEKPLATSLKEAQELTQLVLKQEKILMTGHLLLYHPAVNRLAQLVAEGVLGEIKYIESCRLNTNPHRPDKSVLWDLGPHDLSMMMMVLGDAPKQVLAAKGQQTAEDGLVDIVHVDVLFESGVQGHLHNSWVHPVKDVRLTVKGSLGSAILDDTLPWPEKLKLTFDSGEQSLDILMPEVVHVEPLKMECQHFLHCIQTGRLANSGGENGQAVVACLEVADAMLLDSLKQVPAG